MLIQLLLFFLHKKGEINFCYLYLSFHSILMQFFFPDEHPNGLKKMLLFYFKGTQIIFRRHRLFFLFCPLFLEFIELKSRDSSRLLTDFLVNFNDSFWRQIRTFFVYWLETDYTVGRASFEVKVCCSLFTTCCFY